MDNKILIIEEMFDPLEKMQLIRRGFETTSDKNYYGMKILQIKIKSETSGFLRNKQKTHQFNLIAPGSSTIEQEEDGHYSVIMEEGDILSAVI